MPLTEVATGTLTPGATTEQTLATDTTGGVYVLTVDTVNMVNGDEVILRMYDMAISGGTLRVVYYAALKHAQGSPIKQSPPVPAPWSCQVSLAQTVGTFRAFPWSLMKL